MAWSVKVSQPWLRCEPALCAVTVKTLLSSNTPCSAQSLRSVWRRAQPRSFSSSLKMLTREGGALVPTRTEKDRPCAWLGPW